MAGAHKISVAVCASGEIYGGVEEWVYTFLTYVHRYEKDMKVHVVLFYDGPLAVKLRHAGIMPHVLVAPKYQLSIIHHTARLFRSLEISHVHIHGYKANVICSLAARLTGCAIIKTEHSRIEPLRSWKELVPFCRMIMNLTIDALITLLFAQKIVYVSHFVARHFRVIYAVKKSCIIYNGILPECASSTPEIMCQKQFYNIAIVGRLSVVKGHSLLLNALEGMSTRIPFHLHIVGNGELRERLEEECRQRGLVEHVTFWGYQENALHRMKGVDLLVMPSVFESMPYTLLEALHHHIPIIATNVGGIPEIITDGKDGILIERTKEALIRSLEKAYHEKDAMKKLAEEGSQKVRKQFTLSIMTERYKDVYRELSRH